MGGTHGSERVNEGDEGERIWWISLIYLHEIKL
jgi:hypothetical protein